ncbi:type 2 lantipeptide synthetase LanM [Rathayibacter sp. VKM Ac-2762]|uniref:type 2 lanthipeptide synthetase LanM n=1 Tax=Rathayibacter sp. VKM Ac-2762 TaxID=2609254 RepID=UPI00132F4C4D|nr:type 2 lanthipeptide synthetase LanM [Rathayibacter sp. VKM Ac-2762]QHF21619.1 type 2 lantipeptide synthetase LanM [Rathayibacter sp. VKM Ac-2762]
MTASTVDRVCDEYFGVFGPVYRPWVERVVARLAESFDALPQRGRIDETVVLSAARSAMSGLTRLGARTLIARLHAEDLPADAGSSAFVDFVTTMSSPQERSALLSEYPVLAEMLDRTGDQVVSTVLECVQHFFADEAALAAAPLDAGSRIRDITFSDGDPHRNGRRVLIVTTDAGRLVYKPRSSSIDQLVARIAEVVNDETGGRSHLLVPATVDRGDHSWQPFIESRRSASVDEYLEYYRRLGSLLALFTAVGGHDMHYENILAVGAQPVPIDLETGIRVRFAAPENDSLAARMAVDAAFGVGASLILPNSDTAGRFDIDLSAAGTAVLQESDVMSGSRIVEAGTIGIRVDRVPGSVQRQPHAPEGSDAEAWTLEDLSAPLRAGYRETAEAIVRSRTRIETILRTWRLAVREILRPTSTYAAFLESSLHPRYLTSREAAEGLFALLGDPASVPPGVAHRVALAERRALMRGDIPFFVYDRPSNTLREAADESGVDLPSSAIEIAAFDALREFVRRGVVRDDHSIHSLIASTPPNAWTKGPTRRDIPFALDAGSPEDVARDLTDRIVDLALWTEDGSACTWLTPLLVDDTRLRVSSLDLTLYQGGGLTLLLEAAHRRFDDPRYARALRGFAAGFHGVDLAEQPLGVSGFTGLGSVAVTLAAAARVTGDPRTAALSEEALDLVARRLRDGEGLGSDFIGGVAGVTPLLAAGDAAGGRHEEALTAAVRALRAAPVADDPEENLAHGRLGVLVGLAHAAPYDPSLSRDELADGLEALVHREAARVDRDPAAHFSWCKGLPGALRGAVDGLRALGADRQELEERLGTAAREAFTSAAVSSDDMSLCHGTAGALSSWVAVARALGDEELLGGARAAGADLVDRYARSGFRGGVRNGESSLGFMLGVPGFAHALLEVSDTAPCTAPVGSARRREPVAAR